MATAKDISLFRGPEHGGEREIMSASIPPDAERLSEVKQYLTEVIRLCKIYGLNATAIWAQAMHETNKFRSDLWSMDRNPAGIKDSAGKFDRYRNAVDSARAHVCRMLWYTGADPKGEATKYQYLIGGKDRVTAYTDAYGYAETVADLAQEGQGWAEDRAYGEKIARLWSVIFEETTERPIAVLLVSGHRNRSGGNPAEVERTDDLARAYKRACKDAGIWCEWLQEIDGDTDPTYTSGDLARVATLANDWLMRQRPAMRVPVMLDLHFEGGGTSGLFAVIPDAPGDTWKQNEFDRSLAQELVSALHKSTLIGIRSSGVVLPGLMSEKQTGVGAQGYRLGMFSLTVASRAFALRLVVEHGALDQMPDRAIINETAFYDFVEVGAFNGLTSFVEKNQRKLEMLAQQ